MYHFNDKYARHIKLDFKHSKLQIPVHLAMNTLKQSERKSEQAHIPHV